MGLNISGLVIDKNYKNQLSELENILGRKLVLQNEIIFEETLESWKEDTYCDIYFSDKGTFVLLSMEIGAFDFHAKRQTAFSFVISEMTMMFSVNYTKNGRIIRSIMESDEFTEKEGEPFEFEHDENEGDTQGLIYHLIEEVLGESLDEIDLVAKCYRYTFEELENIVEEPAAIEVEVDNALQEEQLPNLVQEEQIVTENMQATAPKNTIETKVETKSPAKPWWKFW